MAEFREGLDIPFGPGVVAVFGLLDHLVVEVSEDLRLDS